MRLERTTPHAALIFQPPRMDRLRITFLATRPAKASAASLEENTVAEPTGSRPACDTITASQSRVDGVVKQWFETIIARQKDSPLFRYWAFPLSIQETVDQELRKAWVLQNVVPTERLQPHNVERVMTHLLALAPEEAQDP